MKSFFINMALSYLAAVLQAMGLPQLNELARLIGLAFGPEGCRHFCELTEWEQEQLLTREPILKERHTDWPKPLRWVPRTLTCYVMPYGEPPRIIGGTGTIEDIPEPGTHVATRGYIAWTSPTKFHIRIGFRWDRNGRYLEFPSFTMKQLRG